MQDQAYLRQQLLKYIRTAPPGQRLAIFGLTTHLILLQGFTADPAILRAVVDRKSLRASQLLDNATTGAPDKLSDTLTDVSGGAGAQPGLLAEAAANLRQFEADNAAFEIQLRARYTLEALGALARYLAALPGRKNVLWFSGSFLLNIFPDISLDDPFRAAADLSSDLRDTAIVLSRAQVAVYPIDARGLFADPTFDASHGGDGLLRPGAAAAAIQRFSQQTAAEQATMREMAQQTGGRAFVNTNDLAGAVTHALDDGSNFYTLTYSPADTRFDGAYRSIDLKLQGARASQGLSLAYRHGYFAADPDAVSRRAPSPPSSGPQTHTPAQAPSTAYHAAMLRGAPPATEVVFKASVLPTGTPSAPPETSPAPRNQPNPKLAHPPFRSYAVDFAAFLSQVLTRNSSGDYVGSLRFTTLAYNAIGEFINMVDQTTEVDLPPDLYKSSLHGGILFHQVISVPLKGEFYLRLGVSNLRNDRVGSLEVPVAVIKNLPPSAAPAASPTSHP